MRIHDPRFLQQLSRRFCGRPARYLDDCEIHVVNSGYGLYIEITHVIWTMVISLAWIDSQTYVTSDTQPGILSPTYGDDELTALVNRFVRKHRLHELPGLKKGSAA
jgi:hypothetical protein